MINRPGSVITDVIRLTVTSKIKMPRDRFELRLLRPPAWVKIRDQWFGEMLFLCLCLFLFGMWLSFAIPQINYTVGWRQWLPMIIAFGIGVFMAVTSVLGFAKTLLRRRELFRRHERLRGSFSQTDEEAEP